MTELRSGRVSGLQGVRVLEAGRGVATAWTAKLLGDLGADVIKLEPAEGDLARRRGPFHPDREDDPECSGLFLGLNTNKRSIIRPNGREGDDLVDRLTSEAHVVVHDDVDPASCDAWAARRTKNPSLTICAITPFGQTGPYAGYRAEEITVVHGGGWGWLSPGASERLDQPPLRPAGHQATFQAATGAAIATLAALDRALCTGQGESIDYSIQSHVVSMLEAGFIGWTYSGFNADRFGIRTLNPWKIFDCRDGQIFLVTVEQDQWERLVDLMGTPEWATWEVFATAAGRNENADVLLPLVEEWTRTRSVQELFHEGQSRRIAFAPVFTMAELATQGHLRERGFFVEVEHPVAGRLTHLGAPAKLSEPSWQIRRPAPNLDQHRGESFAPDPPPVRESARTTAAMRRARRTRPLDGVRVLDFTWVWAGPFCTLQLAHLGADIIKVETPGRPCLGRRLPFHPPGVEPTLNTSGYFNQWSQGKRSVTLNLGDARGLDLAKRLAAEADVVVDNFAVGVMDRLGLGYEDLHALRPDIIVASISGYGQTGDYRQYVGYGPTTGPLSGLASVTGYEDDGLARELGISLGDPAAGIQAALHIVAALIGRRRTGRGQRIDVSLWEATAVNAVESWMTWQLTGEQPPRRGNRDERWAPYNCYRCQGEDQWITIACATEGEWQALCAVIDADQSGDGRLVADSRFLSAEARKAHEDELDKLLTAWTVERDRWEITRRLQAAGVAAFPSLNPRELAEDPHLEARGFLERLPHPEVGTRVHAGIPWRLAESPDHVRFAAPLMGQHTDEVLAEVLGLGNADIAELRKAGALE
jgi:crotonobetainyl-CoA:carnitine CoA-transferase CaiB-like acyl-CoA transferase